MKGQTDMEFIQFDKDVIKLQQPVKLGFSKRAYDDLGRDASRYINELSSLHHFIITAEKSWNNSSGYFTINTTFGCFRCTRNQKSSDGFTVVGYSPADLNSQNRALKDGIIFDTDSGICAEILLPKDNIKYKAFNGATYDYDKFDCGSAQDSYVRIIYALNESKNQKSPSAESGSEEIQHTSVKDPADTALEEMLDLAEQYAILSSELEEKKTQELGQVGYREFHPADYMRRDRIAYEFSVDEFDKTAFKEGVQVELKSEDGDRISGEILSEDLSDKENLKMTILFNRQIDLSVLPRMGWITLSFSTVNRDVQLAAIQKLRDGTAPAQYFKNVFGAHRPAGFERKSVRSIMEKLDTYKNPPNQSQRNAIERGINTKDIYLVMGPPGTGKTTVILEWVKYFVGTEHKRVLVSSQNNKAVDNVLARLAEEKDIDVLRIGSEAKLQSDVVPYMFENKLADLSRQIDVTTGDVTAKLNNALSEWRDFQKYITSFEDKFSEISSNENILRDKIEAEIIPLEKSQQSLYADYQNSCNQRQKIHEEIDRRTLSAQKYENRGSLMKRLLSFSNNSNLRKLEKLKEQAEQNQKHILDVSSQYNRSSNDINERLDVIKTAFVSTVEPIMAWIDDANSHLSELRPKDPGILHLFERIHPERDGVPRSEEGANSFTKELNDEIAHCENLLSVINEWRDQTVNKQNYALNEIILESVDLVGATCIGINSQKRFANLHFDVTIIDESGQIQLHNAIVPMSVSNKLIMLGDYKQIPPSADQELLELCEENGIDTELLEKSLFEKMFEDLPASNYMMLDTQYRMPAEIADVISNWFYDGQYLSPAFKKGSRGLLPPLSEKPFVIIDTSEVNNRYEIKTEAGGTYNKLEAQICGDIIRCLDQLNSDLDLKEVGIISAYKDQVARIKENVARSVGSEIANEMVATLDSFQGQERDLILYSFTKSSRKKSSSSRIGFLNELRRLNVAMTRPKKTLVMIGDMQFLAGCQFQNVGEDGKKIYEHSEKEFSDFIQTMLEAVESGSGEIIKYNDFRKRIGE